MACPYIIGYGDFKLVFAHVDQHAVRIGQLKLTEAAGCEEFLPDFALGIFLRTILG